jgi:hypothetical protein
LPVIPPSQEVEIRRIRVQNQPGQILRKMLSQKHPRRMIKFVDVVQVAVHLLRKCETLSSNSSTTKKRIYFEKGGQRSNPKYLVENIRMCIEKCWKRGWEVKG